MSIWDPLFHFISLETTLVATRLVFIVCHRLLFCSSCLFSPCSPSSSSFSSSLPRCPRFFFRHFPTFPSCSASRPKCQFLAIFACCHFHLGENVTIPPLLLLLALSTLLLLAHVIKSSGKTS